LAAPLQMVQYGLNMSYEQLTWAQENDPAVIPAIQNLIATLKSLQSSVEELSGCYDYSNAWDEIKHLICSNILDGATYLSYAALIVAILLSTMVHFGFQLHYRIKHCDDYKKCNHLSHGSSCCGRNRHTSYRLLEEEETIQSQPLLVNNAPNNNVPNNNNNAPNYNTLNRNSIGYTGNYPNFYNNADRHNSIGDRVPLENVVQEQQRMYYPVYTNNNDNMYVVYNGQPENGIFMEIPAEEIISPTAPFPSSRTSTFNEIPVTGTAPPPLVVLEDTEALYPTIGRRQ